MQIHDSMVSAVVGMLDRKLGSQMCGGADWSAQHVWAVGRRADGTEVFVVLDDLELSLVYRVCDEDEGEYLLEDGPEMTGEVFLDLMTTQGSGVLSSTIDNKRSEA